MDTKKRGLPLKIDNDGIIDSIVMLQFETDYNLKKLEAILVDYLNNKLTNNGFEATPLRINDIKDSNEANRTDCFYSDGQLKVFIDGDRFVINCIGEYPGWSDILGRFSWEIIKTFWEYVKFSVVGVRYISMLINDSLIENLDGSIIFNNLDIFNGANYHFTCGACTDDGKHKSNISVHLTEKGVVNNTLSSIVDIEATTLLKDFNPMSFKDVYNHLNYCHYIEKDIYYRLLSDKYVDSHNPVWS